MSYICGVDISKAWLDAGIGDTDALCRHANDADGVAALYEFCQNADVSLVVMEASGGLEQALFHQLWALGMPAAIVNPRSVRDFAKAMGMFEKTDRIDALMIARFAAAKRIKPTPPASVDQQKLTALSARMRQITGDITLQKQRLSSARDPMTRDQLAQILTLYKQQHKTTSQAIIDLLETDPLWHALDRTFRTIKGVANRAVATLLAELPEIGTLSNKAIGKLVGLAPIANDSGKRQGKRSIRGGRTYVRSILYLVADIARRFNPSLASFSERLLAKGKPKMVVRIALAHKLLTRLNAMARDTRNLLAIQS
jgi:transposase